MNDCSAYERKNKRRILKMGSLFAYASNRNRVHHLISCNICRSTIFWTKEEISELQASYLKQMTIEKQETIFLQYKEYIRTQCLVCQHGKFSHDNSDVLIHLHLSFVLSMLINGFMLAYSLELLQ